MRIPNFIKSVAVGVPIGITFLDSVGYVARVDGVSMQPALNPNVQDTDYVFLNRWVVRSFEVERGDIVSLISPKDPDQKIIKRIVGVQGDVIATIGYKSDVVRVPQGHCWVEGDHTGHSMDSNNFGPVSLDDIINDRIRTISLINRLEFDFNGSVLRKGLTLGDLDNDGNYELVVGTENGEVAIFKGLERWQTLTNLGFVSGVVIGDVLNEKRNSLVIVTADGWCYIYAIEQSDESESVDMQPDVETAESIEQVDGQVSSGPEIMKSDSPTSDANKTEKGARLTRIHVQRIPPNTKDLLLGDIDGDGLFEMVLGLTDRVVRSYRWMPSFNDDGNLDETISRGKLVALNKWECAEQIGSISLHHSPDGSPSLLVSQPGGSFMKIHHQYDEDVPIQPQEIIEHSSSTRMRNPNISTEILGNLRTSTNLNSSINSGHSAKSKSHASESDFESKDDKCDKNKGTSYAIITLDGNIQLVKDKVWDISVDHQLFAVTKLDVTGNDSDEIVVCSWDGYTYILDQQKNAVCFQLGEPVRAFDTGYYTLVAGNSPVTCFVYVTFRDKILVYFDIPLKSMICKRFDPDLSKLGDIFDNPEGRTSSENMDKVAKKKLVEYLLYGVKCNDLIE